VIQLSLKISDFLRPIAAFCGMFGKHWTKHYRNEEQAHYTGCIHNNGKGNATVCCLPIDQSFLCPIFLLTLMSE